MNRRSFVRKTGTMIAGLNILPACASVSPHPPAMMEMGSRPQKNVELAIKVFRLYDQLHFKKQPALIEHGLHPISMVYADQLWEKKAKANELDPEFLINSYSKRPLQGDSNLLCIDIEHWPYRRVSESTFRRTVDQYTKVIEIFRAIYPQAKIGLFEFSPTSFYPLYGQFAKGGVDKKLYDEWKKEQKKLSVITDQVDVLFPQLYSRWPDNPAAWESCARVVMNQSREIAQGRPVIPFIWPQFWTKNEGVLSGKYWRHILETMYEFADSAVIWSIYTNAPNWKNDAEWWTETQSFLKNAKT